MHWFDVDSSVDSGSLVSEGGYGPNTDVKKNSRRPSVARKTDDLELPAGAAGLPSLALIHTDYEVWGQVLSFSGFVHLIYTTRTRTGPTVITKHNVQW